MVPAARSFAWALVRNPRPSPWAASLSTRNNARRWALQNQCPHRRAGSSPSPCRSLHRLLGETLPVVAILLLQLLDLGLEQLEVAAVLDRLTRGGSAACDHDGQAEDRGHEVDGSPRSPLNNCPITRCPTPRSRAGHDGTADRDQEVDHYSLLLLFAGTAAASEIASAPGHSPRAQGWHRVSRRTASHEPRTDPCRGSTPAHMRARRIQRLHPHAG